MERSKERASGYTIKLERRARRDYEKIPRKTTISKEKIDTCLQKIKKDPYKFKKLEGKLRGYWSYRLDPDNWNYRIVYKITEYPKKIIAVESIEKRKRVYKNMERNIKMVSELQKGHDEDSDASEIVQPGKTKTCSLCLQSFDTSDPLWPIQKRRHEEHHARKTLSDNQIIGTVQWG